MPVKPKYSVDIGDVFGLLTVTTSPHSIRGRMHVTCVCECGGIKNVWPVNLARGVVRSCGCLPRVKFGEKHSRFRHGLSNSLEYHSWSGMKSRCYNPSNAAYKNYGGRGIKVCDEWLQSFNSFMRDMGKKPSPKHSIDRINNNGDYEPGNCRWADDTAQARNKRNNRLITVLGVTGTAGMWSDISGLTQSAIKHRIKRGATPQDAVEYKRLAKAYPLEDPEALDVPGVVVTVERKETE